MTTTAPDWRISEWLNTSQPSSLLQLRGKVVLVEAFQMLCPGCVSDGLPQAQRVHDMFGHDDVAVVGLHSVFEHHAAQTLTALTAFLHEYRISFPVGVDMPGAADGIPQTMAAYQMRGTPTLVLIDRQGRRRFQHFGHVPDLRLGAEIMALVSEAPAAATASTNAADQPTGVCTAAGCELPAAQ